MSSYRVLFGCAGMSVCVYLTLSLQFNPTEERKFKGIQSFHLKGKWVMIQSSAADTGVQQTTSQEPSTTLSSPKRSLCHTFIGRLGNKMFQYASIYAVARNSGLKLVMSSSYNLTAIFSNLAESSSNYRPCLEYTKLFERDPYQFESSISVLSNDTDYLFEGFLQSWKYFEPYKNEIRHQFTFKSPILKQAEYSLNYVLQSYRLYKNLKSPLETFVGIHVRRGDCAKLYRGNSTGINLPVPSYFQRAKDYFTSRFSSVVFVVCSDDIDWCRENIGDEDTVFIVDNPPEVDMAILASLNHTITSFGTFTFWAAWLANGTTIYPKNVVDEHFGKRKDVYLHDHVYHTWIPL